MNSVVEQVAAVLDALSDAEDAVRQRVISLVERLTLKIDRSDIERQKYQDEIAQLRTRVSQLEEENMLLYCENTQLRRQSDKVRWNYVFNESLLPPVSLINSILVKHDAG